MSAFEFIEHNEIYIIITLASICAILFIMCIIAFTKISKLGKRINNFVKTENANDIEAMLSEYIKRVEQADRNFDNVKYDVSSLKEQIILCIQKTGIIRFNPFDDVGGDLSFAVAFLNNDNDGVVISSIYSRECSYSYAKEIKNGKSEKHKLSNEEQQAVDIAMKQK